MWTLKLKNKLLAWTEVKIHVATEADVRAITELNILAWQQSYRGLLDDHYLDHLSVNHRLKTFQRMAENPNIRCFVAKRGKHLMGFSHAGPARHPTETVKGEVLTLYVAKMYHKQGIGFLLWQHACRYLQESHLTPFHVWTLSTNQRARAFYERQGGQLCGTDDHVINGITYKEVGYWFKG